MELKSKNTYKRRKWMIVVAKRQKKGKERRKEWREWE